MDDTGCWWTVWAGHGNMSGLAGKVVAQREDGWVRLNDRASALSGSARSLIETCQPDSQPVGGRPVNHSRMRDRFDKVAGTCPAGSSILVKPPPGLWEVVGAAGCQAAVGTRAQSERVSGRGGTFHSRPRAPLPPPDSRVCYQLTVRRAKAPWSAPLKAVISRRRAPTPNSKLVAPTCSTLRP